MPCHHRAQSKNGSTTPTRNEQSTMHPVPTVHKCNFSTANTSSTTVVLIAPCQQYQMSRHPRKQQTGTRHVSAPCCSGRVSKRAVPRYKRRYSSARSSINNALCAHTNKNAGPPVSVRLSAKVRPLLLSRHAKNKTTTTRQTHDVPSWDNTRMTQEPSEQNQVMKK